MMKAGTYYIGDLCYVLSDRWKEVCEETIFGSDVLSGEFALKNEPRIPFAMYGTAHGDGCYQDLAGREYSVDSGTIGCVSVEYLDDATLKSIVDSDLGKVHVFDQHFQPTSDGRLIEFGHIEIDTDPEEDEYDDYACYHNDEEEEDDPFDVDRAEENEAIDYDS